MADETTTATTAATATVMSLETAIAQYREALKQIIHYERLERQADYGGKNSAKRMRYARQRVRFYEAQRDEALAALQATPEGMAWLDEQERKAQAAMARKFAVFQAQNLRRMIDEYLYTADLMTLHHSAWLIAEKYSRAADSAEGKRLFEAACAHERNLAQWLTEQDAWPAMRRRSAQIQRASRKRAEEPSSTVA